MTPRSIARAFVEARLSTSPIEDYPGSMPADLDAAYAIQDEAIAQWPDTIGGWKVGRIPEDLEDRFGCDRLAGPIFANTIRDIRPGDVPEMPIFAGGFAAVEAEFVAVIAADAPADKLDWTPVETLEMIAAVRAGIEVASSPFADINDFGPAVTISDFGNNAGLVIGAAIRDWQDRDPQSMTCEARVDGTIVGHGGAYRLKGGIVRSVQFMLENAARRGRALRQGCFVATGQTSGIHAVSPGQDACISFADDDQLRCRLVATPK